MSLYFNGSKMKGGGCVGDYFNHHKLQGAGDRDRAILI